MKLKPSMSARKRYFLLEASSKDEIEKTILEYIGILGWAKAAPLFVKSNSNKTSKGFILAVNREAVDNLRAAFAVSPKNIKVLKISGTLKGLSN